MRSALQSAAFLKRLISKANGSMLKHTEHWFSIPTGDFPHEHIKETSWKSWLWWLVLLLVLLFTSPLHIIGYNWDLPAIENEDEGFHLAEIYTLRGICEADLWLPGYPPGILWVYTGS